MAGRNEIRHFINLSDGIYNNVDGDYSIQQSNHYNNINTHQWRVPSIQANLSQMRSSSFSDDRSESDWPFEEEVELELTSALTGKRRRGKGVKTRAKGLQDSIKGFEEFTTPHFQYDINQTFANSDIVWESLKRSIQPDRKSLQNQMIVQAFHLISTLR